MSNFLKKLLSQKPVYTLEDLPPNYKIEQNGIGQYRWVQYHGKIRGRTSDGLYEPFISISEAVESAISRNDIEILQENACNWKKVV